MSADRLQGYNSEIPYVKDAVNDLAPARIDFFLAMGGRPTRSAEQPFTYMELGSGYGLSVAGWAAQHPEGRFSSVDFDPRHAAWTAKLAEAAGLDNLAVYGKSFREMLDENVPPLDYAAMHGVLSWVTPPVRAEIRTLLAKFLKPGGAVYTDFNAMPGWGAMEPLRKVIVEAGLNAGASGAEQTLRQGVSLLKEMEKAGALYCKNVFLAGQWLDEWSRARPNYLAHELLHREHRAFYFGDMLDEMSTAGLLRVVSATASDYLEPLTVTNEFSGILNRSGVGPRLRETLKDFLFNTSFRREIFSIRPAGTDLEKADAALLQARFSLCRPFEKLTAPQTLSLDKATVTLAPILYNPVLELLAEGPLGVGDAMDRLALPYPMAVQIMTVLLALGWIQAAPAVPGGGAGNGERVRKLNIALHGLLDGEPFAQVLTANAGWLHCGYSERLYAMALILGEDPVRFLEKNSDIVDNSSFAAECEEKLKPILMRLGVI